MNSEHRMKTRTASLTRPELRAGACLLAMSLATGCGEPQVLTLGEATPAVVSMSATGHDRLFGVTYDRQGNAYATGVVADGTDGTADFAMMVAKFSSSGSLDTTFGTGGVARQNVAVGTSGELSRGIVVQSTGKIVISGTVEHADAQDARDRDIAVVRFNANGTLDTSFGTNGVTILDLSDGEVVGSGYVADTVWGLTLDGSDRLILTGAQKRAGGTDTDFAIVRLTANGARDATFGTNGVTTVDINNLGANPRTSIVLANGSIVSSGYMTENGVTSAVIFKLSQTGQLDTTFGTGGISRQSPLGLVTEVYAIAAQGNSIVTTGYGRNSTSESLDYVSLRLTANGALDTSYGTNGVTRIDVGGFNDNSRSLIVLPDGRVLLIGGGRPSENNQDAVMVLLTPNGQPDVSFAPDGRRVFELGGAADHFWSVAMAPSRNQIAVVGLRGVGTAPGNDDAALLLVPVTTN
jgi:uncharacterized delta-60 repeat protein